MTIKASIFPYRFSMRDKEPVELTIEMKNGDPFEKMVSLDVMLPNAVGLDKSSINRAFAKRYNRVAPGQTIVEKHLLYLSPHADVGEAAGKINVAEHYLEFGNVTSSYTKSLSLRIVP